MLQSQEQINIKNFICGEEENRSTDNKSVGIMIIVNYNSHTLVICACIFLLSTCEIFNINLFFEFD